MCLPREIFFLKKSSWILFKKSILHSFFSEEAGTQGKSDFLWVIDPIDGTINFSRGIEEYCISLAFLHKGTVKLGIVYQPDNKKLYLAEKGKGAFLNNKRISVSSENKLINTLLATDNSSKLESRQRNFMLLHRLCLEVRHIRIFGSGALHLAKIAEGKLDSYYKTRFNYWDYAAGMLLIEEAGGKITDFMGKPINELSENIIASNELLHNQLIELLNKNRRL
jgi:myo-inositol-1(or 4)-monophosphatase